MVAKRQASFDQCIDRCKPLGVKFGVGLRMKDINKFGVRLFKLGCYLRGSGRLPGLRIVFHWKKRWGDLSRIAKPIAPFVEVNSAAKN